MCKVLLDTGFMITLLDEQRSNHKVAIQYFEYFAKRGFKVYFSTVSVAEYCIKGSLEDLPLDMLIVLPFNVEEAYEAGRLNFKKFLNSGDDRVSVKDDIKLLGQAVYNQIDFIIGEDAKFTGHVQKLGSDSLIKFVLLGENFDSSYFEPQMPLEIPDVE